jgi:hypothetical protein
LEGLAHWQLCAAGKDVPQRMTVDQLLRVGPGDNAHIVLTDFLFGERYLCSPNVDSPKYDRVWLPVLPRDDKNRPQALQNRFGRVVLQRGVQVIVTSSRLNTANEVARFRQQDELQGMIVHRTRVMGVPPEMGEQDQSTLRSWYPGTDVQRMLILEEDRRPALSLYHLALVWGGPILFVTSCLCIGMFYWRQARIRAAWLRKAQDPDLGRQSSVLGSAQTTPVEAIKVSPPPPSDSVKASESATTPNNNANSVSQEAVPTAISDDGDGLFLPDGRLRPELLDKGVPAVLQAAVRYAEEGNFDSVRTPHIFMGLLTVPDAAVRNWGNRLQADLPKLLSQFRELFHQEAGERHSIKGFNRESTSEQVIYVLGEARRRAASRGRTRLVPMDLLVALLTTPNSIVAECFEQINISAAQLTDLANLAEEDTRKERWWKIWT